MSIWDDAFEAYLAAEETDIESTENDNLRASQMSPLPMIVMLFVNQTGKDASPLQQFDAQYSSLVQQFGKDTVDAIRRAIGGDSSDQQDSSDSEI